MEVLVYGLILFAFVKLCQLRNSLPSDVPEKDDDMNFSRVIEETEKIEVLSRKLQVLEHLLTDITIYNSGQLHKNFSLHWINEATGESVSFDFWVNDSESDTAEALSGLANTERSRLRSELQEIIDGLPENSRYTPPNLNEEIPADVVKKHEITE